jgi:RNA-directed DNA polymerase
MLTTLEQGVKGGRWYSLMDKVGSLDNLRASTDKVVRNAGAPGVDGQTVGAFDAQRDDQLQRVQQRLREGSYQPSPVRQRLIPKPGTNKTRALGIPTVTDRVVQTALKHVLEPIFEARFLASSYGFRPGRSAQKALDVVETGLRSGKVWVVDADIADFFGTIDRALVRAQIAEVVSDGAVLELVDRFMAQSVMDSMQDWKPVQGVPQGSGLSPLLANIHLHPVDVVLRDHGLEVVRYADDLVVLCRTEAEAHEARKLLEASLSARGLSLHPDKTRVVNATVEGFDFLGYHFGPSPRGPEGAIHKRPRDKSLRAFKDRVRGLTRRLSGVSLETTIKELNPVLRGWWSYFRRSEAWVFVWLDRWIRRRLRAIVLRHEHRSGRCSRGSINMRVPNAKLAGLGLFSLSRALATVQ